MKKQQKSRGRHITDVGDKTTTTKKIFWSKPNLKLFLLHIIVMLCIPLYIFLCLLLLLLFGNSLDILYALWIQNNQNLGIMFNKKKNNKKNVLEQDGKWRNYIIKMHFVNTEMKIKRKNVRKKKKSWWNKER